jgi:hypothetical protein
MAVVMTMSRPLLFMNIPCPLAQCLLEWAQISPGTP